uniref:Uncharacterized protein n=1 Tax=Chromera velia CCMP2878 TaxID=1169474 RepID=A0A0G4GXD6_9ALVE|eukprot:Cvel_5327.t1-p1 / transcript=Cvel_5327.t1 / gene=Cvel_5327 / organism=Chromera_velia_CCMP2878 / gene_product=hypothetical protein / transcript_product=hypothetical protein / location=Cvel_scaffold247:17728-23216(-) / protein_length=733 / sequence_SO=supercontig / SO=protein_coding / is_pseudo=false
MRFTIVAPCIALLALVAGVYSKDGVMATPLAKVLKMLGSMLSTSKKEIHEEQIAFSAFKQWCEDTSAEKGGLIEKGKLEIEELKAAIEKGEAEAAHLTKEIEELGGMIESWAADMEKTKKVREEEKATFDAALQDYMETIDALERAIDVMKTSQSSLKTVKQAGSSLVQTLKSSKLASSSLDFQKLAALFNDEPETFTTKEGIFTTPEKQGYGGLDYKAPEAHAYEFKSNGVVDMLEKLLDKFTAEKNDLEKEEASDIHAFEMTMADLKSSTEKAEQAIKSKTANKGKALEMAGEAKTDLAETEDTLASNEKYLSDLISLCKTKNSEFQSRQKLREEEITALSGAIDVLTNVVQGHVEKYLPADVVKPTNSPPVPILLQTGSKKAAAKSPADGKDDRRTIAVAQFLQKAAARLHSKSLDAVAMKARMSGDAFEKVKKMITELIDRLMNEAAAEMKHKAWCDKEIAANEVTRKEKTEAVNALTAEIEEATAKIAKLAQEIVELTDALTKLEAEVAEAVKNRAEEKTTNETTISDAIEAQQATAQAIAILQEYYAKAGAPALLQTKARALRMAKAVPTEDAPLTWDEPYTGQLGSGGVIDMLQVIQTDFARIETETKADEAQAAKEHDTYMDDAAQNKLSMEKDVKFKEARKAEQQSLKEKKSIDLEDTQKQLDAAKEYFEKLKPACLETGSSYEQRVADREEEIASLKQALAILSGDEVPPPPEDLETPEEEAE